MAETNKVVVHCLDGKIVKGSTQDFAPNRALFHLRMSGSSEPIEIKMQDLKAVYFVKDFAGSPRRKDVKGFGRAPGNQGKKIAVRFRDGELLCGTTLSYTAGRQGFFVIPADQGGNNLRIYVISESTAEVKAGPAAESLARKVA